MEFIETISDKKLVNEDSDGAQLSYVVLSEEKTTYALQKWRDLEQRLSNTALTTSADWVEGWLSQYGDQVKSHFLLASSNGQTRGVCLLTESENIKDGPISLKTLHFGTAGESDNESACVEYNRILVEPEYRNSFIRQIFEFAKSLKDWDQFQWDGITEQDLNSTEALSPMSLRMETLRLEESRYFNFEVLEDGTDLLSHLGKSTRSNIRRRLKQFGSMSVDWAETKSDANEIFEELVVLHQARWEGAGENGAFASKRFHGFLKELIEKRFDDRGVALVRIRQEENTIGCLFLLVDDNRLLDYVSGFASFEEYPSAGMVCHYLCMEEAHRRNFDAYDFLVGEKRHKQNLGKQSTNLVWAAFRRPRWKFQFIKMARSIKQLVRPVKKNNRTEGGAK